MLTCRGEYKSSLIASPADDDKITISQVTLRPTCAIRVLKSNSPVQYYYHYNILSCAGTLSFRARGDLRRVTTTRYT